MYSGGGGWHSTFYSASGPFSHKERDTTMVFSMDVFMGF